MTYAVDLPSRFKAASAGVVALKQSCGIILAKTQSATAQIHRQTLATLSGAGRLGLHSLRYAKQHPVRMGSEISAALGVSYLTYALGHFGVAVPSTYAFVRYAGSSIASRGRKHKTPAVASLAATAFIYCGFHLYYQCDEREQGRQAALEQAMANAMQGDGRSITFRYKDFSSSLSWQKTEVTSENVSVKVDDFEGNGRFACYRFSFKALPSLFLKLSLKDDKIWCVDNDPAAKIKDEDLPSGFRKDAAEANFIPRRGELVYRPN